jgi:hypothetical protein
MMEKVKDLYAAVHDKLMEEEDGDADNCLSVEEEIGGDKTDRHGLICTVWLCMSVIF